MMACPAMHAHTDLQLQIFELSNQLAQDPENVQLLLRRGDLQRRHENWDLARADFKRVRELQPGNETVDWFEGRLEVQAGQPVAGVRYLERFLNANPNHLIALQNRAQGYLMLNQPLLAANDFQSVILASERPTPSLYRANTLALIRAGDEHYSAAMKVVLQGLSNFPAEVTLTAMATDLSLAQSDTVTAKQLMSRLPAPIHNLPQWQTRNALLECQSGYPTMAAFWFSSAVEKFNEPGKPPSLLSGEWLARLAAKPDPENCQGAAIDILNNLQD
jgi:tetratricopeptide (TPR) repeat protein